MAQIAYTLSYNIEGKTYSQNGIVTGEMEVERKKDNFPAAKDAVLSTRTDNDTGVLTFTTNPGLSVGDRIDVYWNGGARRTMKVSNITGTGPYLITIGTGSGDVGVGDVLPAQDAVITVGIVQGFDFPVVGNNVKGLLASCAAKGTIILCSGVAGSEVEEWAAVFESGAGVKAWTSDSDAANPITGDTITRVLMSHGDSTGTREVKVSALVA